MKIYKEEEDFSDVNDPKLMLDRQMTIDLKIQQNKDLWKDILRIADKAVPKFSKIFVDSVKKQGDAIDMKLLEHGISTKTFTEVDDALKWQVGLEQLFIMSEEWKKLAFKSGRVVSDKLGLGINPYKSYSYRYINEQGANLVKDIDNVTRENIRELLRVGFRGEKTSKEIAIDIRQYIGLDWRQTNSLERWRAFYIKQAGYDEKKFQKLMNKKIKQMIAYRANRIARTETAFAGNYGAAAMYKDAMERGVLPKDKYYLGWLITPDDRLCPKCANMKNEKAEIGGIFESVGLWCPPLHPQCRCTTVIRRK